MNHGDTVCTRSGRGTITHRQLDADGQVARVYVELDPTPSAYFPDGVNGEWFYIDEVHPPRRVLKYVNGKWRMVVPEQVIAFS